MSEIVSITEGVSYVIHGQPLTISWPIAISQTNDMCSYTLCLIYNFFFNNPLEYVKYIVLSFVGWSHTFLLLMIYAILLQF